MENDNHANGYYYNGKIVIGSKVLLTIAGTLLLGYATWLTAAVTSNQQRISQLEKEIASIQATLEKVEVSLRESREENQRFYNMVILLMNDINRKVDNASSGSGTSNPE